MWSNKTVEGGEPNLPVASTPNETPKEENTTYKYSPLPEENMTPGHLSTTMPPIVVISNHTTASTPRPHIRYTIRATRAGKELVTQRRYSEFVALHDALKDPFNLPPKRLLVTTFIPSAWVDDALIAERKSGLAEYLEDLLSSPKYKDHQLVYDFLLSGVSSTGQDFFDPEDAVPSTLSRNAALNIAGALAEEFNTADSSHITASYYPDWSASRVPPEGLDFSKWDVLYFAFVTPNSSSTLNWGSGSQAILRRLVASAKNSGRPTKIVLAVGGWGGCYYFSQACSSAANRTKFTNALVSAVNTFNLDGIDLDWEYPNSPGAGQPYSSKDSQNLLSLIQLLRSALGPCKILSAAVPHEPWLGADGKPLKDVSEYAALLSYINIMNYDVWGASANPGPNAPIGNLCGTSWQPKASAQGALTAWKAAKFPERKMLLGLALYGYVSKSTKKVLTGSSLPTAGMLLLEKNGDIPQSAEVKSNGKGVDGTTDGVTDTDPPFTFLNGAHANDIPSSTPPTTSNANETVDIKNTNLTSYWGRQIAFNELVRLGAIKKGSDGNYRQGGGFTMGWDDCSNTPYLFNTSQQTVVSYDDTWSLTDKAKFAVSSKMAGVFTWSLDQDDGVSLQNAIRKGLGK